MSRCRFSLTRRRCKCPFSLLGPFLALPEIERSRMALSLPNSLALSRHAPLTMHSQHVIISPLLPRTLTLLAYRCNYLLGLPPAAQSEEEETCLTPTSGVVFGRAEFGRGTLLFPNLRIYRYLLNYRLSTIPRSPLHIVARVEVSL